MKYKDSVTIICIWILHCCFVPLIQNIVLVSGQNASSYPLRATSPRCLFVYHHQQSTGKNISNYHSKPHNFSD